MVWDKKTACWVAVPEQPKKEEVPPAEITAAGRTKRGSRSSYVLCVCSLVKVVEAVAASVPAAPATAVAPAPEAPTDAVEKAAEPAAEAPAPVEAPVEAQAAAAAGSVEAVAAAVKEGENVANSANASEAAAAAEGVDPKATDVKTAEAAAPEAAGEGRHVSANAFASGDSQNCGNMITDRSTTRVRAPPGGYSTFSLA